MQKARRIDRKNGTIDIDIDEEGAITVVFEPIELWFMLTKEQREEMLRYEEGALYSIAEAMLKDTLTDSWYSPSYMPAYHKLREELLADSDMISNATYRLIERLSDDLTASNTEANRLAKNYSDLYYYCMDMDVIPPKQTIDPARKEYGTIKELKEQILEFIRKDEE